MTSFIHTASTTTYMVLNHYIIYNQTSLPSTRLISNWVLHSSPPMVQWHQKHNRLKRWIDSQSWLTAPPPLHNSSQNVRIISMSLPTKHQSMNPGDFASINLFHVCPCYILSAAVWDLSVCCAQLLSHVWLFLWPYGLLAHQDPLSMGFPRQEYWSGMPFPSLG